MQAGGPILQRCGGEPLCRTAAATRKAATSTAAAAAGASMKRTRGPRSEAGRCVHPRPSPLRTMALARTTAPRTSATSALTLIYAAADVGRHVSTPSVTLMLNRSDWNGKTKSWRQTGDVDVVCSGRNPGWRLTRTRTTSRAGSPTSGRTSPTPASGPRSGSARRSSSCRTTAPSAAARWAVGSRQTPGQTPSSTASGWTSTTCTERWSSAAALGAAPQ